MLVLVLADVHGNRSALEAVLGDARAAQADHVVVAGDAVPGPECAAVLDLLDGLRQPTHRLRGNGEREVAEAASGHLSADLDPMVALTATRTAEALGRERAIALGALPLLLELDGVLFCHASPRRDDEMLTRISPTGRYRAALRGRGPALVVAGHTHQQDLRRVDGIRWCNAGSVGMPYEGDGAARWALIRDGKPELVATAYDAATTGQQMLRAGWPDVESITAALIDPLAPQMITELFEANA